MFFIDRLEFKKNDNWILIVFRYDYYNKEKIEDCRL